jgi:hypothetical protein
LLFYVSQGILSEGEDTVKLKLQSLWEEITRVRWQSQAQIQFLTDEITRLQNQTQEQQEQILHLIRENVQIRQQ